MGVPAARHAAQAPGETGVIKQPAVFAEVTAANCEGRERIGRSPGRHVGDVMRMTIATVVAATFTISISAQEFLAGSGTPAAADVRFAPESGHSINQLGCPLCATSGRTQCSRQRDYSITSSANNCIELGTPMPGALAVLRLMTNWNFVDCTTGRSAGFSPLRIRPT